MEVKFDLVRIGGIRKNLLAERNLKLNVNQLRNDIRYLLKDEIIHSKQNKISIVMIIPQKGYQIKISVKDIEYENIREKLKFNFPNSIYKGKLEVILDNLNNKLF